MLTTRQLISLVLTLFVFDQIQCQSTQITGRIVPGACDALAVQGVQNCLENYLPISVLSQFSRGAPGSGQTNGICCNYSKYRACISGLYDGLRIAGRRNRCPQSMAARVIEQYSLTRADRPLGAYCGTGDKNRYSKCTPVQNNKSKKNNNSKRDKRQAEDLGDEVEGGQADNPILSLLQPFQNILSSGSRGDSTIDLSRSSTSSLFDPVRNLVQRGREVIERGTSTILNTAQGVFDSALGGLDRSVNPN